MDDVADLTAETLRARMGEDAQLRQQITQLESQFEQIGKRPD